MAYNSNKKKKKPSLIPEFTNNFSCKVGPKNYRLYRNQIGNQTRIYKLPIYRFDYPLE